MSVQKYRQQRAEDFSRRHLRNHIKVNMRMDSRELGMSIYVCMYVDGWYVCTDRGADERVEVGDGEEDEALSDGRADGEVQNILQDQRVFQAVLQAGGACIVCMVIYYCLHSVYVSVCEVKGDYGQRGGGDAG